MKKLFLLWFIGALGASSCSKVPITGRRQVSFIPESQMVSMSATAYDDFLKENNPLPESNAQAQQVKRVGLKISKAVEEFLKSKGHTELIENFDWEFHTVDDPTVNAWCMPGGRVVFYTGILPLCKDDAGIAVVMGHEVAHAVAKHGNERMSQALGIQGAGQALSILTSAQPETTRGLLLQSYGIGSQLGSLAFSRKHETEADKLGLVFMAIAGYDPRVAPAFWERMAAASNGGKPPELLSTHPSDDTRIKDLNDFMPEALKYYKV